MSLCLIGLGSNQGDRKATILRALRELGRAPDVEILRSSQLIETAPIGGPREQGPFLNAAAVLRTARSAESLFSVLQQIEDELGRRRVERWGPRTIDLDLLLFGEAAFSSPRLTVPHPRMAFRRFVLEPAVEIAPAMVHPVLGWSLARLLEHLDTAKNYLAITGPVGVEKTAFAHRLAACAGARLILDPGGPRSANGLRADSSRHLEVVELEWALRRACVLSRASSEWNPRARLWLSDFWLDESLAFAKAALPAERWAAFQSRWEQSVRDAVRPKLVVALTASTDWLWERIAQGRDNLPGWTHDVLERLCQALDWCLARPDVGPVLRLVDPDAETALAEAIAAIEGMSPGIISSSGAISQTA